MKTIEELKELKAIGVTYYKDQEIEVKFSDYTIAPVAMPIIPTTDKEIPFKKDTLEQELFNQY